MLPVRLRIQCLPQVELTVGDDGEGTAGHLDPQGSVQLLDHVP